MSDKRKIARDQSTDEQPGLLGGVSKLIVSLMWGVLLVVLIVVFFLAQRFYATH